MLLKNNSNNEWLGYDCGGIKVDIKAGATFEVSESCGQVLLRNLGSEKWLTKVEKEVTSTLPIEEPKTKEEVKEEELVVVEKEEAPKKKK
jgi:hypothetical protein